jgi:parvulin-like peptidyl-prolyl isomerase
MVRTEMLRLVAAGIVIVCGVMPAAADSVLVSVNGDPVYVSEVQRASQQLMHQAIARGEEPDLVELADAAVERVIDSVLLAQEARRRGITATQGEVAAAIADAELHAGGPEQLDQRLSAEGIDRERLRMMAERSLILRRFVEELEAELVSGFSRNAAEDASDPDASNESVEVVMDRLLVNLREQAIIESAPVGDQPTPLPPPETP